MIRLMMLAFGALLLSPSLSSAFWPGQTLPPGTMVRSSSNFGADIYLAGGKQLGVPNLATRSCLGYGQKNGNGEPTGNDEMLVEPSDIMGFKSDRSFIAVCSDRQPNAGAANGWPNQQIGAHDDHHQDSARHVEGWAWARQDGKVFILLRTQSGSLVGECGGVVVGLYDKDGKILQQFTPPSQCSNAKQDKWQPFTNVIEPSNIAQVRRIGVAAYIDDNPKGIQKAMATAQQVAKAYRSLTRP